MRVLVAGPTGVLGRPTVRRLVRAGHEAVGLVRSDEKAALVRSLGGAAVRGDVLDAESVLEAARGAEAVINLATAIPTARVERRSAWELNDRVRREGARNLIRAARRVGAQVYVQGSVLYVYGDHGESWIDEEASTTSHPMIDSAIEAEEATREANGDGLATVILRFGTPYARDAWHTQLLVDRARKRELPILGDGRGFWSLIHADDAARATVLAMEDGPDGAIYNVADDEPVRMADLVTYLAELLGAPAPRRVPTMAARLLAGNDVTSLLSSSIRLSNRLIRDELGFEPAYPSFREGLAEVLAGPVPEPP
jgi:2-alkyl-3-oxoalkanoate reductase